MRTDATTAKATWASSTVSSPQLAAVPVVAAEGIPYVLAPNHRQRLNVYLPQTDSTTALIGSPVVELPGSAEAATPHVLVHVHGGAWRDPHLTSSSIEAVVARAFTEPAGPITAIASIDYTISPFPTHPDSPYDPDGDRHSDPAREAVHPQHLSDVLHGLNLLRSLGMTDDSYLLSGHSCGACIAAQAVLASPQRFGIAVPAAPRPAALLGFNGLYDLPALVDELGPGHQHLRGDYEMLLTAAFGDDPRRWVGASPASFDVADLSERIAIGTAPRTVLLDQSVTDQLVPIIQKERFAERLAQVDGLRLLDGHRCTGRHAAPWQQGTMIWQSVEDVLATLGRT